MEKTNLILTIILVCLLVIGSGQLKFLKAQSLQNRSEEKFILKKLFTEKIEEDIFSENVLRQVNIDEMKALINRLTKKHGNFEMVKEANKAYHYEVFLDDVVLETIISLNGKGKIAQLQFKSTIERINDLEQIISKFKELDGNKNLLVTKNDEEIASINPEKEMSVGSTFKLAVLAALDNKVEKSNASWNDTLTLKKQDYSLPSGILQDWPVKSSFTIYSLAGKMISLSDNTATDMLINYLGRSEVEKYTYNNKPLLKTRELFKLKNPNNKKLLEKYRNSDLEGKYKLLNKDIQNFDLPTKEKYAFSEIRALDLGWFFTPYELKDLMEEVHDLHVMRIENKNINSSKWNQLSFKTGRDLGVINYTALGENSKGEKIFFSASWNNEEGINVKKFDRLFQALNNILMEKY